MKSLTLVFITLLFSFGAQAQNTTAVFSDSQFTASDYGRTLLNQCLNPNQMSDASQVELYAQPSGHTGHLLRDLFAYAENSRGQTVKIPVHRATYRESLDWRGGSGNYHVHGNYERALNNPNVNRIMIFMGVNEIDGNGANWKTLAEQITSRGKHCYVGLPPLTRNAAKNRRIVAYNQKVQRLLMGTNCRIVDTSRTLTNGVNGLQFTESGWHFHNSQASSLAEATCQAISKASRHVLPTPEQAASYFGSQVENREPVEQQAEPEVDNNPANFFWVDQ